MSPRVGTRDRPPLGSTSGTGMAGLLTDLYELTMADVYRREGIADRCATFSLFVRKLPSSRSYLVAAGLDDVLQWLERLHFGADELNAVDRLGLFDAGFLDWLADLRFTGTVRAVPEGEIVFAEEPILEVDAPVGQAQLAETFLLNQVTLQTTLATKAARCRSAAGGKAVVDFGLRRAQGVDAGMKVARICGLVGLAGTSNVAGANRYGIPAVGTMAHAFVQAYEDEVEAFRAFARAYGDATVLVVDTYDSYRGIDRAVQVCLEMRDRGVALRGVRLDSGDLAELARYARRTLDEAGLDQVLIFASGGLDECEIHQLMKRQQAPIDGFGVGTSLAVSSDAPTLDSVYKMVEFDGRPVHKTSTGKATWPGRKQVWRREDWCEDVITLADEPAPGAEYEPLLHTVMQGGRRVGPGRCTLSEANRHFEQRWIEMPPQLKRLTELCRGAALPSARLIQVTRGLEGARFI